MQNLSIVPSVVMIVQLIHKVHQTHSAFTHTRFAGTQVIANSFKKKEHAVAELVQAPCCKLEGRGFESRWGGFFQLT
jgi:hypothetical protein